MTGKLLFRVKMVLYAAVLVVAELLQTSVFGSIGGHLSAAAMPVAVVCICLFEGSQRGCIFGLIGGCLWAWSSQMSYYGAFCIVMLTLIGAAAGFITDQFLLRGILTAVVISIPALLLTEGLYLLVSILQGSVPIQAAVEVFLPELLLSLLLCIIFYPLSALISRIGGSHG